MLQPTGRADGHAGPHQQFNQLRALLPDVNSVPDDAPPVRPAQGAEGRVPASPPRPKQTRQRRGRKIQTHLFLFVQVKILFEILNWILFRCPNTSSLKYKYFVVTLQSFIELVR